MADPSTAAPFSKRMLRYADIGIALMLVLIVGMIIPMPTMLLDVLLALNITFGVVVLLSTFYVRQALEISAFPTILLISTSSAWPSTCPPPDWCSCRGSRGT